MLIASIVVYKTAEMELKTIVNCALNSAIHKIYIVDNSPSNESQTVINSYHSSKLIYIWGHGNIGYGAGHNMAIKKSIELGATYHIILNPDIIFQADAISSLTQFMDCHPDIGSVMPNIIYPDGRSQKLCKLLPTPYDIFARRLLPKPLTTKRNERYEMHSMGYDKSWNCPNLSGCFMFLRTDILKQIGGFDDRFFMYFEDTDLIRRIHQVSITAFYPNATIIHAHKAEHRTSKTLLKISIKSAIKYFNKYGWFFDKERRIFNKRAQSNDAHIVE
jgi:GT2 family glycosyltransferase